MTVYGFSPGATGETGHTRPPVLRAQARYHGPLRAGGLTGVCFTLPQGPLSRPAPRGRPDRCLFLRSRKDRSCDPLRAGGLTGVCFTLPQGSLLRSAPRGRPDRPGRGRALGECAHAPGGELELCLSYPPPFMSPAVHVHCARTGRRTRTRSLTVTVAVAARRRADRWTIPLVACVHAAEVAEPSKYMLTGGMVAVVGWRAPPRTISVRPGRDDQGRHRPLRACQRGRLCPAALRA
ncbi:hypothetical protein BXY39_3116 [Eilatimonas milleporae]|uniref:Uncharacterized protein n=1 Tax=Eilatimonas milleporae TaxID=911205 RepID=A0A3M0BYT1_9PROT|nr:hypothetical protein BXY39_3116 [Eilatimonas milleporae]